MEKLLNQLLLEVLMNCTNYDCTKHFDLRNSLTASCVATEIHDLLTVPIIFFWIGFLGAISG